MFKELQDREKKYREDHKLWFDAPAQPSDTKKLIKERADALRSRVMHYQLGSMDAEGDLPTLTVTGKLKVDWIDFPFDDILQQFTTLKEGILRGVFRQKAAAAWFGCRAENPRSPSCFLEGLMDCMSHSWPKSCNIGKMQVGKVHAKTFHLRRKFTRARHMWLSLRPNWYLLRYHMYTEWPGIYTYDEINDRLFVNPGRNDNIHDTPSKAWWWSLEHLEWLSQQQFMSQYVDAQVKPVRLTMQKTLANYERDLMEEQLEINAHKGASGGHLKRWKTKQEVYQLKY